MIVQQKVIVLESHIRELILQSFWPILKFYLLIICRTQKHRFDENVECTKVSSVSMPKSYNFISCDPLLPETHIVIDH